MEVGEAVTEAKQAAQQYAGAAVGIRVEEVEHTHFGWRITLSWLEHDAAEQIRQAASPMRHMSIVKAPPPLERVYRGFEVRDGQPVKMLRVPEP